MAAGLGLSLVLLLLHAWAYRFQCDDAFISFRYARNLAQGAGLVFNAGFERVEGYTNFLWVLILAGAGRLGIPIERAADGLSLAATVALWALVAWFAGRRGRAPVFALVPVFLLAATRSVAVWSTSGLETRWFEALLLGGVLRLVVEVEAGLAGRPSRHAWAGVLLALATLTRPDGLLISGASLVAASALLVVRQRLERRWLARTLLPFAALVGGHLVFRRLYYGEWLPNTYFAKIDGLTWWDSGGAYLAAFGLEYAAYLWLPLIALGVVRHARRGSPEVPLLFAAAVLPHALYVAAIGGDHFEYRPLDAYFPFAFLLVADGLQELARFRARAASVTACLALLVVGLWELPWQSHLQFPGSYASGFPGMALAGDAPGRDFLDPARDPLYGLPGLRAIAATHRDLLRTTTSRFVGIRQEEHRMFLATAVAQARLLEGLVDRGILTRDLYMAVGSVGAIPYVTDFRTLDRHGLTDAHVAHSGFALKELSAHGKVATLAYASARGVDLWAVDPVRLVVPVTSRRLLAATRGRYPPGEEPYAAEVAPDLYLLAQLPRGVEFESRRLPALRLRKTSDPTFIREYRARVTSAFERAIEIVVANGRPQDAERLRRQLAAWAVDSTGLDAAR